MIASATLALALTAPVARAQAGADSGMDLRLFAAEIKTGPRWDAAQPPQQQAFFREHSANLRQLRESGHLVLGARYADKGLIILSAPSADEARAMMNRDPAIAHGTFAYELHDFSVFYGGNVPARARR